MKGTHADPIDMGQSYGRVAPGTWYRNAKGHVIRTPDDYGKGFTLPEPEPVTVAEIEVDWSDMVPDELDELT